MQVFAVICILTNPDPAADGPDMVSMILSQQFRIVLLLQESKYDDFQATVTARMQYARKKSRTAAKRRKGQQQTLRKKLLPMPRARPAAKKAPALLPRAIT